MGKVKKKSCKAKGCRKKFTPNNSLQQVCGVMCAIALDEQKKATKAKEQRKNDKVKIEALRPASFWGKRAVTAFNKFIRERDKDLPCISCGRYHTGQYHAGHFMSRGARPELQFHPSNNNKQCAPCNTHLSGNISLYRPALILKVGLKMVEYLEIFNNPQRLTIDELKEIEQHYKNEYKRIR